jgi:type II secretory pathway pseudopilin PulG
MKQSGFTLLEILLTLALTVVVLGLLGMAVDVHLRLADASRNEVETARSARLILWQIADDLRKTIPVTQAAEATPASIGCLQGNREELQVDISRLPLFGGTQPAGPPNDVRTVLYSIAKPADGELPGMGNTHQRKSGLLRNEWEHATFAWAVQQGQTSKLNDNPKVLSPDVEAVEFTYLDADDVYQEWDSLEKGKLPTAVKVAISIRQPRRKPKSPSVVQPMQVAPSTIYSVLVDLPNARSTLAQTIAAAPSTSVSQGTNTSGSSGQGKDSNSSSSGGASQ